MSDERKTVKRRDAAAVGSFVGGVIEPLLAKRGFATADLIAAWADVVGPRYARSTQPDRLIWPRTAGAEGANRPRGATLVIRVDAGMAIYLQHETAVLLERINGFLGFGAVTVLKIVQAPVSPPAPIKKKSAPSPAVAKKASDAVAEIESDALRDALERLGRGVFGEVERS